MKKAMNLVTGETGEVGEPFMDGEQEKVMFVTRADDGSVLSESAWMVFEIKDI